MIYIIPLIFIIISILRFDFNDIKQEGKNTYNFILVILVLIAGLQYRVGSDTPVYMQEFNLSEWSDFKDISIIQLGLRQIGWVVLLNVVKSVFREFFVLQIILAVFLNYSFGKFFWKYTSKPFSALLIYFFALYLDLSFNVLRQGVSIGFFLLSYDFFIEKKWSKYYMLNACGLLFHSSAVILLFVPLFSILSKGRSYLLAFILMMLFSGNIIFDSFSSELNALEMNDYVSSYLNSKTYGLSETSFYVASLSSFIKLFILFFIWKFKLFNYKLVPFLCLFCLFATLASKIIICGRLMKFFMPFVIIYEIELVYNIVYRYMSHIQKIALIILLMFPLFNPIRQLVQVNPVFNAPNYYQYYPYNSIIDKNIPKERKQFQL